MKFFIIFINVVLPTNLLCQVYQIDPLIISMAGIEIKNGEWKTTLDNMNELSHRTLCSSVIKAPIFIYHRPFYDILETIFNRDQTKCTASQMVSVEYQEQKVNMLSCSGGPNVFYLSEYSKYDGYILFTHLLEPLAVVTRSDHFKIINNTKQVINSLKERKSGYKLNDIEQLLFSYDEYKKQKLCATFTRILFLPKNTTGKNKYVILSVDKSEWQLPTLRGLRTKNLMCAHELPPYGDRKYVLGIWMHIIPDPLQKNRVVLSYSNKLFLFEILDFV